jgi:hypothetical protein
MREPLTREQVELKLTQLQAMTAHAALCQPDPIEREKRWLLENEMLAHDATLRATLETVEQERNKAIENRNLYFEKLGRLQKFVDSSQLQKDYDTATARIAELDNLRTESARVILKYMNEIDALTSRVRELEHEVAYLKTRTTEHVFDEIAKEISIPKEAANGPRD